MDRERLHLDVCGAAVGRRCPRGSLRPPPAVCHWACHLHRAAWAGVHAVPWVGRSEAGRPRPYAALVAPFLLGGVGMSLFFAPTANAVLAAVGRAEEGKASGVLNTIRQVGGVFGVAVLASVFSTVGGYGSPGVFVDGLSWALWVGAAMVGLGAVTALAIPSRRATRLRHVALTVELQRPARRRGTVGAGDRGALGQR